MMQTIVIFFLSAGGVACAGPNRASAPHTAAMLPMASRRFFCGVDGSVECIFASMRVDGHERFVYHQSMDVRDDFEIAISRIAAAIGETARARILYCLMDGRARTGTELAVVAEVSPSTASVHLSRLKDEHLLNVLVQGKHRYYSVAGTSVANVLESLSVLAGGTRREF